MVGLVYFNALQMNKLRLAACMICIEMDPQSIFPIRLKYFHGIDSSSSNDSTKAFVMKDMGI